MFEKLFAKYARAVGDSRERERLFKKFKAKQIVLIIFYVLCVAVIISALALSDYIEQDWAFAILTAILLLWIGFSIAYMCLWLSFRKAFKAILQRPAQDGEMPEITAYRQKALEDKQSTFKKMLWAWIVFIVCLAVFAVCIIVDAVQNPDSEEIGVLGGVAIAFLLVGVITLTVAYVVHTSLKQQKGATFEMKASDEADKIDAAQGRKPVYKLEADKNLQTYKYLFPNPELYEKAEAARAKQTKILNRSLIPLLVIAVAATALLLCSEKLGKNVVGYTFPVIFTLMFLWIFAFSFPTIRAIAKLEKLQKAELETNPEYSENLRWYKLYTNFSKFKGKIYLIFFFVGIALGWVLAALFPETSWSATGLIFGIIGLAINYVLVKDLRKKAIPIEREIDGKESQ